jgi:hypothetical protein
VIAIDPVSAAASRTQNRSQSKLVSSHLCGLMHTESARSSPAANPRCSGHTSAAPAQAASTCNQGAAPDDPIASARAGSGSNAPVEVVPSVATTSAGVSPARRSASNARARSAGSIRRPASVPIVRTRLASFGWSASPATIAALITDECACVEV